MRPGGGSRVAFNLNAIMKGLALGEEWKPRRMKAMRFHLINIAAEYYALPAVVDTAGKGASCPGIAVANTQKNCGNATGPDIICPFAGSDFAILSFAPKNRFRDACETLKGRGGNKEPKSKKMPRQDGRKRLLDPREQTWGRRRWILDIVGPWTSALLRLSGDVATA